MSTVGGEIALERADPVPEPVAEARPAVGWFDPTSLVLAALLAAPAAVALVSALRRPFLPVSDWALIESSVRDVGTSSTPLIGAYSRFGWHHPGPWPFYLLAGPYRLFGAAHGILGAAAVWNLAVLVAIALVVRRLDRLLAVCALPVISLLVLCVGARFLADPWNPYLPVLPLALLVPVAWGHGRQARWALPAMLFLASLIVQAHLGFLPVVAAIVAYALVARVVADRRSGRPLLKPVAPLIAAALVLVAMWTPPLIDQVRDSGNLSAIVDQVRDPGPPVSDSEKGQVGWSGAPAMFARQFGVPGPWLGAPERQVGVAADRIAGTGRILDLLPLGLTFALAAVVAARRRDGTAGSLLGLCALAMAGCFVGLVAIRGVPYEWLVRWCRPIAAWAWIAAFFTLARAILDDRPAEWHAGDVRRATWVVGLLLLAGAIATSVATTLGQRPQQDHADLSAQLAPKVLGFTKRYDGVYLVPALGFGSLPYETNALLVAYERKGLRATTDLKTAEREHYRIMVSLTSDPDNIESGKRGDFGRRLVYEGPTHLHGPGTPTHVAILLQPMGS